MQLLFAMQAYLPEMDSSLPWSSVTPVYHSAESDKEGVDIAYGISHQLGNITVRMTRIPNTILLEFHQYTAEEKAKYVGNLSGVYIQSREQ